MLEIMCLNTTYKTLNSNTSSVFMTLYNDIDHETLSESTLNTYIDILKNQYIAIQVYQMADYIIDNEEKTNNNTAESNQRLLKYISSVMSNIESNNSNIRISGSVFESANQQLQEYQYMRDHPNYIGIKIFNY